MAMNLKWPENHHCVSKIHLFSHSPECLFHTSSFTSHPQYCLPPFVSWWPYWQLPWENWNNQQKCQFPTTMPTHLLTQLWGLPASPHRWIDKPSVFWSKAFPSTYALDPTFSTLVKNIFKKYFSPSSLHNQIPSQQFSLVSIETCCFSYFGKRERNFLLIPLLIWAPFLLLPFRAKLLGEISYLHCLLFLSSHHYMIPFPIRLYPLPTS